MGKGRKRTREGHGVEIGSMMGFEYDVFLSFRGPDTRRGFTDHLYCSMSNWRIRVFKDDTELRRGEKIGGELERAINKSKIYIVIFSKDYASSVWCLRELAMMVNRQRESSAGEKVILPIFYDVDPDDVKRPTGLYHRAVDEHENRRGPEIVQKWKEALSEVCRIGGWEAKNINGDGKLVELIVQYVIGILKLKDVDLPEELIEIDDRVDELTKLLNLESPDVRFFVVHGMGGIGKTTLAKIVFNKISPLFTNSSFLSDVRSTSSSEEGVVKLRKQLLCDILGDKYQVPSNSNTVIGEIKRRLRGERLLVVLDDVDKRDQIEKLFGSSDWFGPGTRIIITSRDKGIVCGLMSSGIDYFEMKEMDDDHALRLFTRHAFVNDELPDEYVALSKDIASAVGNLPLALVVIGRHLCQFKSKEAWKETLTKLLKKEVYDILKVSYDGLEDDEQEIFLDIACLSDRVPKTELVYLWQARSLSHVCGLEALVKKSLIKILPDDTFWMHDQVQGMGKEIVRQKGNGSLGMRSRLWDPKDAQEVVHQKKGTDKVLAINLGVLSDEHKLACEEFEGMSNIIFLRLIRGQFIGDFGNVLTKLMWLHWEQCKQGPNVAFFNTNNLVVLKISGHGITDELMRDLRMGNLRLLELKACSMTTMPDLSWCSKLERIIIKDCFKLKTLHSSVGKLEVLTLLRIMNCWSLRSLPEELGSAKALQELSLIGCENIEELPESLRYLRVVRERDTKIWKLHGWIGNITSRGVLEFRGSQESSVRRCGLDIIGHDFCLPSSINNLASLSRLKLEGSAIRNLPDAFAELVSLEFLSVVNSKVRSLPGSVSDLKLLAELRLFGSDIEEIPGSIGRLENLRVLDLSHNKIRKLPTSIGNLKRLKELDASYCPLDEGIPEEIGGLSALITLSFQGSMLRLLPGSIGKLSTLQSLCLDNCHKLLELPTTVRELSSLRSLSLCNCNRLRELPELPTGLTKLEVTSGEWQRVPNLSLLTDLTKLRIPILLPPNMSSLSRLETLQLSFCLPWARYSEMRFLHKLNLSNSPLMEIRLSGLDMLENLRDITVTRCKEVVTLSDIASLRQIRTLTLSDCPKLVNISGVEGMAQLEDLDIVACKSIRKIPDLSNLRMMKELRIRQCDSLLNPPNVNGECQLVISGCWVLRDFGGCARDYAPFRRDDHLESNRRYDLGRYFT